MTAFNIPVLFGSARFDIPQADPGFLHGEWEFAAVVDLDFPDEEGQSLSHRGQEIDTGAMVLARIEPQDAIARAVIQGRVLKTFLASDAYFLDIDLHTIAGVFVMFLSGSVSSCQSIAVTVPS